MTDVDFHALHLKIIQVLVDAGLKDVHLDMHTECPYTGAEHRLFRGQLTAVIRPEPQHD